MGQFRVTEFAYDSLLRLTSETADPGGEDILTQYQYMDNLPAQDRVTIDPDNYYTRTKFDNDGRVTTEERFLNPAGATGPVYTTSNAYDTNGRLQTRTIENKDQDGNSLTPATLVTQFSYDRLGRLLLRTVDPGGISQGSHFDYNWLGDVEREFDTSGRGAARTYEGRGLIETETPLALNETPDVNLTSTFTYDALGNLRFIDRPTGTQLERIYDDFSRLEQEIRHPISGSGALAITTTFEYDAANHITRRLVDENGTALSDVKAEFDEGGFNYRSRTRLQVGVDGANDLVTERKFDWAGNVTEEKGLGDTTVNDGVNIHRVVTTFYDGASRVETVTDSEGGETVFTRDDRGNVTEQRVTLQISPTQEYAYTNTDYDALGRAIKITDPEDKNVLRHYRERRYDSRGNLLRETLRDSADNAILTTVFGYDNAGRQTRQAVLANPAGFASPVDVTTDRVTDTDYDADGRLETRTTYNNNTATPLTTTTTYDTVGRVDTVTDPSNSSTDDDYATNGRLSQRTVDDKKGSRVFTFGYDGHDRIQTQTVLGTPNLVTTFAYDGLDFQIRITDPKAIVTKTEYDLAGRRVRLTEDETGAKERITEFGYNSLSQLITHTAKNKADNGTSLADQVTTYRYDTLGRQRRAIYPDSTNSNPPETCTDCVRTEYDDAGRMISRRDQRNLTTTYVYDDRGLMLTRTTFGTRETMEYDAAGRLVLAQRGTTGNPDLFGETVFHYNGLGDLDDEVQTIAEGTARMIDYAYDQAGNRTSLTYPGGETFTYVPTALNQVDTISLTGYSNNPILDYSYIANGPLLQNRRTVTSVPAGLTRYDYTVDYDSHRRVNSIANTLDENGVPRPLVSYALTHDNNSNPATEITTPGTDVPFVAETRTYTVDRLNRLTQTDFTGVSASPEAITLDLVSNRESYTDRGNASRSYTLANPANEYATIAGQSITYDGDGNQTLDEEGRRYSYDVQNRLTQIKAPAPDETVLASYTYDGLGRRVTATLGGVVTRYYYDGHNVIEERNGSDVRLRLHLNGTQYIDERVATYTDATQRWTYYLLKDNYSVAGTGNADGSLIESIDYSVTGSFAGSSRITGDYDRDGDVDGNDFMLFQACRSGPAIALALGCEDRDLDPDNDVDQDDFGASDWEFLRSGGLRAAGKGFVQGSQITVGVQNLQTRSEERFLLLFQAQQSGDPLLSSDVDVFLGGLLLALGDITPSGGFAETATGIGSGRLQAPGESLTGGTRLVRGGLAAGNPARIVYDQQVMLAQRIYGLRRDMRISTTTTRCEAIPS